MDCRKAMLLCAMLPLGACAPTRVAPEPDRPESVLLFIGDGVGVSYWTAARFAADVLNVERFPVVGLVDTRASSSKVTDSAAAATAYASGIRTYNGAIGVAPDTTPVQTVLELAELRGMATGLVATSTITHATPAAFAAHIHSRNLEGEIAAQMVRQGIEVILGGGRRFFDGTAPGAHDLLADLPGYTTIADAEALAALDPDTVTALLGLFEEGPMPPAPRRSPSLADMTRTALRMVARDPDGFFLMVEGSQPDWRGHDNDSLSAVVAEMLDFDAAIGVGLRYQDDHPETLVVVVADHETGGLAVGADQTGSLVARYVTPGHTAQMIPLFARGPGAQRFGGIIDNDRVGQLLIAAVSGRPDAGARR